ncbi:centromere-associated protein E isoform X6 [Lepisosteus oculatus]|uniref:centromere-associated protein E isoform X6 n=1 Tax=Lepisosteus oculatus TaxID=7918 RepID=UPI0035F50592
MAGESAVKVCVRVRPLIQREEAEVSNVESVPIYWKTDQQTVYQVDGPKTFSFDRVFNVNESTSQVYDEVAKPLVISAIKGYNGTIFAYGQTSSGKTFTMMGSNESLGVIPLAIHDIFETIAQSQNMEFLLRVSYMEIYNETVTDLLVDSTKRKPLEIREGINRTVYVADLTEEVVVSASQVLEWIKKGEKNRHYGDTKMNQRSSRSHTIFRMILESRERSDPSSGEIADQAVMVSHLNLVDLAGSERASQTGAEGLRLKEGCNINRSLFTLGQVIKKLTDGNGGGFTNYRDSKLTRILQNSLGGNAKTVIICTITPATVEETLSTLQFASTAKHMKNDPHVNEVLDDGALMRRYRNEIVDLKRRLEEVSSETRMQATEKEVLAQLLQEKDQLQKEQEDRIRNLTKIVITSSSFAINDVKIRSKRRMTWGGKLLRGRQSEGFHFGDIGFLEHATKRKKSDLSALIEPDDTLDIEGEDVWQHNIEDFPFDVEMNMSNVSVRRSKVVQSTVSDVSASTPNSLSSQIQLSEVKERIAGLEEELQKKIRETWEAVEKQNAAEKRVSELEEALKAQDPRGEGSHVEGCREALCKMYEKDFRDTIQLCETLVAEKEELSAKLNLLKEELDALWKEKEGLQQEKVRLQQEIIEKEEQHEFNILEQEVHKQSETELAKEITSLKMELENSGVCIQNLKAELEAKSNELQNKEEWIAELENMGGKDLTEQIRNLKHSLGDAEAVSRDTKKEWAFLRSENLTLKERENDMAARYKQMEVEVNQLRSQLESEKMRFKRMETDLQKELLMAFEENAKLNTLLDGKVPKNLIERLDLEKSVAELKKELEKSQEGERALQTEVNSLSALKNLPDKVDDLMKQVCDVSNELCATRVERDDLLSAKVERDEEIQRLTEAVQQVTEDLRETQTKLSEADQKMANLSEQHSAVQAQYVEVAEDCEKLKTELESSSIEKQQCLNGMEDLKLQVLNVSEELQLVNSERDSLLLEKRDSTQRTEADLQELRTHVASLTQEREQLQEILESVRAEKSQLKADLEEKMVETQEELRQQQQLISDLKTQRGERETQLEQQINDLSGELKLVSSDRDSLLSERRDSAHRPEEKLEEMRSHITSLTQEREQLQEILESVRAEKSQLKAELEEKMVETQEELRQQQQLISDLKTQSGERETQLEDQVNELSEKLKLVSCERDSLLSERRDSGHRPEEELEELRTHITSLTQEREQLQEILESVRAEKSQLKIDLEENVEMSVETQEELRQQQQLMTDLKIQTAEKEAWLQQQITELSEKLKLVSSERDSLPSERRDSGHRPEAELEEMRSHIASLTQEREQLQEILESVRAEKSQLKAELEEKMVETQEELRQQQQLISDLKTQREERETQLEQQVNELSEQLKLVSSESETLLSEKRDSTRRTEAELEELRTHITSLTQEREQLQETLESVRAEKSQLQAELEEKINKLNEELKLMSSQHDTLLSESRNSTRRTGAELEELRTHITSLTQEREQLQETLESVRAEKSQLKADLEENISVAVETQAELCRAQDELRTQQELISDLKTQRTKRETQLDLKVNELSEQLQLVNSERDSLLLEKRDSTQRTESDLQELRTHITSLTQEREQLQETLESVRAEKSQLNSLEDAVSKLQIELHQVQGELNKKEQEAEELKGLVADKEVQLNSMQESLSAKVSVFQQLVQGQERALEERDRSLAELQGKVAALAQERQQLQGSLEHLREQLESQTEKHQALIAEFELQSQASVSEDQRQSQRLKESEEQYQECLKRFQLQIDQFKSCAKNISALLNKDTTSQSKLVRQFVSSLPAEQSKSMLKLNSGISKINTDLVLRLRQQACVYSSIAEIHKDHFETALQHSIASFEERKLHDLLIQRIQRASGSSSEHVSQQAQRASDLLEERQRQVQEMTEILAELEDGLSCHATSRAQEHPIQEEINRTLKALCAAPTAGFVELEQVLQKENTRMTEKLQQTTQVLEGLKAKYYDIKERCQALLAKSTAELKEQRDRSQTLLVELDDGSPKKGSEVLQENLLLLERLEGSEKEIKTMQLKIKKLEGSLAGAEAKAADRKRAADGMQMELQKLVAQVKERDESISTLRRSLSELEKKAEKGASPYIEELETLRSKLVKMEMERTGLLKKQEQTVAAMTAALEHRDESLRKLKETLRKSQQDQEASFVADEKPHTKAPVTCGGGSGIVQSTMMLMIKAEKAKLEAEVHQQKKKIGQMESVVSSLQAEASKWKGRARKLKETSGLKGSLSEMETLCDNQPNVSPRTPTKRRQVTSEGFILDSPKSKFFDSRSGSLSVACPKQFFDNSTLGTIPDVNPTAEPNSEGDWWSLAPQKDGAENCKTQ